MIKRLLVFTFFFFLTAFFAVVERDIPLSILFGLFTLIAVKEYSEAAIKWSEQNTRYREYLQRRNRLLKNFKSNTVSKES